MNDWSILLVLLATIAILVLLQQLRGLLSLVYPDYRVYPLPDTTRPPAVITPLFTRAESALQHLGFSGRQWALMSPSIKTSGTRSLFTAWFYHPASATVAIVTPPMQAALPNQPNIIFVTQLEDGRLLGSHTASWAAELFATSTCLAQSLKGDTLADQWQQHLDWFASFDQLAKPISFPQVWASFAQSYAELIQAKKIWVDTQGIARLTLPFSLSVLKYLLTVKKPTQRATSEPVTPEQLTFLANIFEKEREALLPAKWQWWLFGLSSLFFIGLGTFFWSPEFALLLLLVIVLHEGGHYLAMRYFGYHNVQMLALPLLGGITMGTEKQPDANQRVWIAMMGVLPGILLGAGIECYLYNFSYFLSASSPISGWLQGFAFLLLLVNCFNLLPIPPLDGSHIVRAMFSPRHVKLNIIFLLLAGLTGALVAWLAHFQVLSILPLLPLFGIPAMLKNQKLAKQLTAQPGFFEGTKAKQLFMAFEVQQRQPDIALLPPIKRVLQAEEVCHLLTTSSMTWRQRLVIALVYLALFAVSIGVILQPVIDDMIMDRALRQVQVTPSPPTQPQRVRPLTTGQPVAKTVTASETKVTPPVRRPAVKVITAAQVNPNLPLAAQARAKNLRQLLKEINIQGALPEPASEALIQETEMRLHQVLPPEIKALYRIANGVPALGILPLSDISWSTSTPQWHRLNKGMKKRTIILTSQQNSIEFDPSTPGWLYLGGADPETHAILYRTISVPGNSAIGVEGMACDQQICRQIDLRHTLEAQWIALQQRLRPNLK